MSEPQAPYVTQDTIMARYMDLSLAHEIPDMQEYAKQWQQLAMDCDKEDRVATAETCRKNAKHYCEMYGGEYIRLVEGCFAELIPIFDTGGQYLAFADEIHVPYFARAEREEEKQ